MAASNIKASIPCDVHRVWKAVTEVENYTWRSDLSKTEVAESYLKKQQVQFVVDIMKNFY